MNTVASRIHELFILILKITPLDMKIFDSFMSP